VLQDRLTFFKCCRRIPNKLAFLGQTILLPSSPISSTYVHAMMACLLRFLQFLEELSASSSKLGQSILNHRWIESDIPLPAYVSIPSYSGSEPTPILSIFSDVFLWMAVPKKKTSHTRKRLRQLNYQLRNLNTIYECPLCGHSKRTHRLCLNCLKQRLLQLRSANKSSPGS
jgi:ribosomal protein L32